MPNPVVSGEYMLYQACLVLVYLGEEESLPPFFEELGRVAGESLKGLAHEQGLPVALVGDTVGHAAQVTETRGSRLDTQCVQDVVYLGAVHLFTFSIEFNCLFFAGSSPSHSPNAKGKARGDLHLCERLSALLWRCPVLLFSSRTPATGYLPVCDLSMCLHLSSKASRGRCNSVPICAGLCRFLHNSTSICQW